MTHTPLTPLAIEQLRRDFDASFRSATHAEANAAAGYLLIGIRGVRYALALKDIASLHGDVRLTPVPSRDPGFLGLCGVRSELLAVYDLGACLGHEPLPSARWIARVAGTTLAFAFAELERQTRVAQAADTSVNRPSLELADSAAVPLLNLTELARTVVKTNRLDTVVQPKEFR